MLKKTFTLMMASLMAVTMFAADIASRITVSFTGNNNYELLIDGRRYHSTSNRMLLNDIRPGRHSIQVYALNKRGQRTNRPVYASNFTVRPQYDMHISVDRNGRVQFDESSSYNRDRNDGYDRNDRDWNNGNRNDNRWDNNYSRAMSDRDYSQLVQQVRRQWTASRKYSTARDAAMRYHFSTQQVRGLLQQVAGESQRLDLAKIAYRNTVDNHNYGQVYNLFSRNAQRDLDNYIRSNRY